MNLYGHSIELTTNHASSSHGIPVLVIDGNAYGPCDETPLEVAGRTSALGIVRAMVEDGEIAPSEAKRFGDYNHVSA